MERPGARARGRSARGGRCGRRCRAERRKRQLRWGLPPGKPRRGHTPVGSNVTLWDSARAGGGGRRTSQRVGDLLQVSARPGGGGRARTWLRPQGARDTPSAAVLGVRRCSPGARTPAWPLRGPRAAARLAGAAPLTSPGRLRSCGLRAGQGRPGVGIRRKGSARRKRWTLEAAERQKRLRGPGGGGWEGGDVAMEKALGVRTRRKKVCRGVGGALPGGRPGYLDAFWPGLCDLG